MDIEFKNIEKSFLQRKNGQQQTLRVLAETSFSINSGEFFSIIGPSGCGKSTLLNLLAGLETPDRGQVVLGGSKVVTEPGPDRAVVFQEHGLMPWMTVRANVEYGLKLAGIPKSERSDRAMKYLKMVHLGRFADSLPHQLSGGMKQRVAIARGLALEPQALLMDEPFSALDAQTRDVLHEELQRIWQETKTTILFVTHNLSEAVYLSDRILIMTTAPGRIKSIVRVPYPHPRAKDSEELSSFSAQLHSLIREEVNRVQALELDPDWKPEDQPRPDSVVNVGEGI